MTKRLLTELETAIGRKMRTPRDFALLHELIFQRLHENVSPSTLKRLWGYFPAVEPRESTLTILARFLGYRDWEAYCSGEDHAMPSSPIIGRWLDVDYDLSPGSLVKLTWAPGRVCIIKYEGKQRFVVVSSEATRLQPDDTFECMAMIDEQPLYLHNLQHDGQPPVAYVCGLRSGIHYELLFQG